MLGLAAMAVTCQNIFKKKFNKSCNGSAFFFTGMIAVCAMLFFVAFNRDFYYAPALLGYSAGFALSYAAATIGAVLAMAHGSLAKSALIISCSLLIPGMYGILVLEEPTSATLWIGTPLLILALFLINYEKSAFAEKSSLKWCIFVFLAFLGNGMCSVVQKAKQKYTAEGNNLFMIVALAMVAIIMLAAAFLIKEERIRIKKTIHHGVLPALICGVANGLTNLLVIYLNPRIPASTLFPVISGGNVTLSFLYSVLVLREKFSPRQTVGFLLGVIAIILLNL